MDRRTFTRLGLGAAAALASGCMGNRMQTNTGETAPGPLMVDLRGTELESDERDLLQRRSVGGVILFARNYRSPAQLRELTAAIRESAPRLLIAVDQEGGRVQRFIEGFVPLPSLRSLGVAYERDPAEGLALAVDCGWVMASELVAAGLDFSFAPVLDRYDPASPAIGERAFASEPGVVASLAGAYIGGMSRAGMAATGKHFPGHGMVAADSHLELPVDDRDEEELRAGDLQSFLQCHELLGGIMSAHVVYPRMSPEAATFSSFWLNDVLRGEIGFKGVVFSDDLSMEAVRPYGRIERRVERALTAGIDMVLVCNDRRATRRAVRWLDRQNLAGSPGLQRMRAQPPLAPNSEQWRKAVESVSSLHAATSTQS
ncbi:MAG: beta-N-acetylhexosaminidase [Gammaproteobacteria bacterium]|nr:beta-N-acetylhexosaminidase [Gammaproteobacteria bacterium]